MIFSIQNANNRLRKDALRAFKTRIKLASGKYNIVKTTQMSISKENQIVRNHFKAKLDDTKKVHLCNILVL